MKSDPNNSQTTQSVVGDYTLPWPIPQPRLATYIMLFFLLILWPGLNLALLVPGQYEINYEAMDPVFLIFIPTMIIEYSILLGILLVIYREKTSLRSIGLVRPRVADIFLGLGFFVFAYILVSSLGYLLTRLGIPSNDSVDFLVARASEMEGWWLAISITAAICEEIAFRGFLITRLRTVARRGWFLPVLLSSFAFGAGHAYQGVGGLILLTILGLLFGGLFLFSRSLWPAIIAHFIIDISAIYIQKIIQTLGL